MRRTLLPLLTVAALAGYAQVPESPQALPSPNAFAFMQVKKIPVSYHTGLPNIEVPLHQVSYGGQAINLSLTYSASGFMPEQHASTVGTNWSLHAGGMVTRKVNKLVDEYSLAYRDVAHPANTTPVMYDLGWLKRSTATPFSYNLDFLTQGAYHWVDVAFNSNAPQFAKYPWPLPYRGDFLGASCVNTSRWFRFQLVSFGYDTRYQGTLDVERDEFSFSMFGYSGKFYFNDSSDVVVVADKKFKVTRIPGEIPLPAGLLQPNSDPNAGATCPQWMLGMSPYDALNTYPNTIAGFTIEAEDGTKFYFGNHQPGQDAIEYSIGENYRPGQSGHGLQNYAEHWIANGWHLTAVRFRDGRVLSYDYERGEYNRVMYHSEQVITVVQHSSSPTCGNATSIPGAAGQLTNAKIISPVYLKHIYGDMIEADFSYSNTNESNVLTQNAVQNFQWKKLDTVSIKDYHGNTFKWVLTYDPLSSWSQRLFLGRVEKFDPVGVTTGERYGLQYNNSLALPNYNEGKNDHWGYWNNVASGSIVGLTNAQLGTLRAPSLPHTAAGMLNAITYPTGTKRRFTYELNTCRKVVKAERMLGVDSLPANVLTGGLRIAAIQTVDTVTGVSNTMKYYYVNSYDPSLSPAQNAALPSSGVRNVYDYIYHWSGVIGNFYEALYPTCLRDLEFSISSQQPLYTTLDAYHIGYSTVVEVRQDSAYTVRRYTNHDNGHPDDSLVQSINAFPSPYRQFSSRALERGKEYFEGLYTKTGKLVKSTETEYAIVPAQAGAGLKTYMDNWSANIFDISNGNGQVTAWVGRPGTYVFSDRFKTYTYAYLPIKTTTYQYQDNANTYLTSVQETEYGNPAHWQPTLVRQYHSNGKIAEQVTKYPLDYPATFVTDRFTNTYWLNVPVEKINLLKDSATAPARVTSAELNEMALFPHFTAGPAVPMNVWQLQLASPILLSSMTTTVPVTYDYTGTTWKTAWTKDPRYKLVRFNSRWDSVYNKLEERSADGQRTRTFMGYRGLLPLGVSTTGALDYWHASVTSFETMTFRTPFDYATVQTVPDGADFMYLGTRDTTVAYTGKSSFSGRLLMRERPFLAAHIYIAIKNGGNMPFFERYDWTTGVFTPISHATPDTIKKTSDWTVLRYSMGNGSIQLCINSNGNLIDDVRITSVSPNLRFNTITYVNGRQTEVMDRFYNRVRYEYDATGRVIRIRDDKGNITEQKEYKFRTPVF
ncbi:hypothetical protein [Paraflavitalea pollutisoli]|uniref:hypothetical protein n=1 Tax=Paraflavitalea pollutisoli TaxID=3034143 RepID=UPI0023EA9D26|nr:hypothetical protein [Paraflavitalea sp. H1-2-19X]